MPTLDPSVLNKTVWDNNLSRMRIGPWVDMKPSIEKVPVEGRKMPPLRSLADVHSSSASPQYKEHGLGMLHGLLERDYTRGEFWLDFF